jgi:hypothetical protein
MPALDHSPDGYENHSLNLIVVANRCMLLLDTNMPTTIFVNVTDLRNFSITNPWIGTISYISKTRVTFTYIMHKYFSIHINIIMVVYFSILRVMETNYAKS